MISKNKKYFSFFGILAATVNRKIASMYSSINELLLKNISVIIKILLERELKPMNHYSTNKKRK